MVIAFILLLLVAIWAAASFGGVKAAPKPRQRHSGGESKARAADRYRDRIGGHAPLNDGNGFEGGGGRMGGGGATGRWGDDRTTDSGDNGGDGSGDGSGD